MRRWSLAFLSAVLLATTGCASSVSHWIVQTRTHQGDIALRNRNYPDASVAYQLALRVDSKNAHARAGLIAVQTHLAETLFAASRFDDAVTALAVAAKYAPGNETIQSARTRIEQAEIKRDIVVSNYPNYKETGAGLRRSFALTRTHSEAIAATLKRFDYTYDSSELTLAIRDSYELRDEIGRLTDRLIAYRQLVDSGVPENADTSVSSPGSLLPLP